MNIRNAINFKNAYDIYKSENLSLTALAKVIGCSRSCLYANFTKLNLKLQQPYKFKTKDKNPNWKGGRYISGNGYVKLNIDGKIIYEHTYIYCKYHNLESVPKGYVIHPIDGDKMNNKIENLEMKTISAHIKGHLSRSKY